MKLRTELVAVFMVHNPRAVIEESY